MGFDDPSTKVNTNISLQVTFNRSKAQNDNDFEGQENNANKPKNPYSAE